MIFRQIHFAVVSVWLFSAMGSACYFSPLLGQDAVQQEEESVELSKLDTFLKNKDGRLIQYFKITFEEFEKVYNALKASKGGDGIPTYSIRSAEVTAKIRDQWADLTIALLVEPKTADEMSVPVGFGNGVFPVNGFNKPLFRENREFYLRLKGEIGKPVQFVLKARQNVKTIRGRKTLELDLPSATFTKVLVHEVESNQVFSASQDSISKQVDPWFQNGSSFEFSGLKEKAIISWIQKNKMDENRGGEVVGGAQVVATIHPDRIEYAAKFSVRSDDPISGIDIGLPGNVTDVTLNSLDGRVLPSAKIGDPWKNYRIELDRVANEFEDIEMAWVVSSEDGVQQIVGFELADFSPPSGQLTVNGFQGLSFVLANPYHLDNENRNAANKSYSYSFDTTVFSASVFTLVDSPESERRIRYRLWVHEDKFRGEMEFPPTFISENPGE
ncbi:MAG: hypothetical protein VX438_00705, partial [Planctomycetota bacterium]|nr:hypothetical protein [Planctomycetota bacterium]